MRLPIARETCRCLFSVTEPSLSVTPPDTGSSLLTSSLQSNGVSHLID